MELKEILAISKLPGLYKMVATRSNGIIVSPLGEDAKKFVSSRQHMFTPLENITIYTNTDSIELVKIFETIKKDNGKTAIPDNKAKDADFRAYFTSMVPDHDQEKVYVNDIKKVVKWYALLDANGLITLDAPKTEETKKEKAPKETKAKTKETQTAKNVSAPKKSTGAKAQPTRQKK